MAFIRAKKKCLPPIASMYITNGAVLELEQELLESERENVCSFVNAAPWNLQDVCF